MLYRNFTGIRAISEPSQVCGVSYIDTQVNGQEDFSTQLVTQYHLNQFLDRNQDKSLKWIRKELVQLIESYVAESQKEAGIE